MRREIFEATHDQYRSMVREFVAREVVRNFDKWEVDGHVSREFIHAAGERGILGIPIPVDFGGAGDSDYRYNVVLQEEVARAFVSLGSFRTHTDVVLPYFLRLANDEQRRRWLPGIARGEIFTAIAMTEPSAGSDLSGITTSARRDGDDYIVNGSKTFITGGLLADLVIVIVRTAHDPSNRRNGLTLLVIENGTPGFSKGRLLSKLGLKAQDTVELSFQEVRVPAANVLGREGAAFEYLENNLAQERLAIAVGSVAQARAACGATVAYAKDRRLFGSSLNRFQNTRFELAAVAAELEAAQALLDKAIMLHVAGELDNVGAAKTKLFCTEMQGRAVDRCLQLFGGYGYITEYPIARLYADARVSRIYGGSSEVMKLIISKSMGL